MELVIEMDAPTTAKIDKKMSFVGVMVGMRWVMPQLDTVHITPFICGPLLMAIKDGDNVVSVVRMVMVELMIEITDPCDVAVIWAPSNRFAAVMVELLMSSDMDVP